MLSRRLFLLCAFGVLAGSGVVYGQSGPLAPAFSSRANAPYTMYLNFSGFSYTGTWSGQTPGVTPAYNGQTGSSFTASEQANIKNIWARVAESYAPFNVNVTTVDPAVAAGQAGTDLQRQNYYDATSRLMHTVIGNGSSTFYGSAGGVSFVDVWSGTNTGGRSTNWVFTNRLGGYNAFHNIFTATSHENGHAASLSHQGDYIGTTRVNSYSTNNGSATLAPIMGVGYSASRNVWREGRYSTNESQIQNDPRSIIANNPGMGGFVNDAIGRTLGAATPLALLGTAIDFSLSRGIIVPVSSSNPNPIGVDNYTKGLFSFTTTGGLNSITVNSGSQWLTAGVSDPDATLDATLRILDFTGAEIAVSNTASLSETLSLILAAGNYYIEVSSAGGKSASLGPAGTWAPANLYDMGSYFLTGNIMAVPEPASFMLLLLAGATCLRSRRRQ